jgi:4-hydroxybenzoate polyprenyltransferase
MPHEKPTFTHLIRASEWWEYKLSPLFATLYATCFVLQLNVFSVWPVLLTALVALVPGAAYVCVINDLTDYQDDINCGKENRLVGKSRPFINLLIATTVSLGILMSVVWMDDLLLLIPYLGAWLAFSLYSIPPFRLKGKGGWGVLADASGAHLFPTLLVLGLVFRWHGEAVNWMWYLTASVWAFCFGLRGILWHQLSDLQNDNEIGLPTFAQRHGRSMTNLIGMYLVFPTEILAFVLLLWLANNPLAVIFLSLYGLLELLRMNYWKMKIIIVNPRPNYRILMNEYYDVLFPLAFLIALSIKHPYNAFVLVFHLCLFPTRTTQMIKDLVKLIRLAIQQNYHRYSLK